MSTDEKSKNWYRDNAEKYTAHVRDPKDSVYHSYYEKPAMYALLPDVVAKSVLSIGCGSGEDSHYLKTQGAAQSIGIDMSEPLIAIAKATYQDCEFRVMNMEELDFPPETFDFAYSSLAIHYVEDLEKVLREVFRVLKPHSRFLVSIQHPTRLAMVPAGNDTHSIWKIEMSKNRETKEVEIVGDYMAIRKVEDVLGKNTVNTWTRPMGDIATCATNAGFLIERLVEPRPLEELREVDPKTYYRLSKLPEFVIFRLLRP